MSGMTERQIGRQHDDGFALLATVLILFVGALSVFFAASDTPSDQGAQRPTEASVALGQARELVLARALSDTNRPGAVPCAAPGTGGKGTFHGDHCDADAGRFPYRTLETPPLRDAGGAQLWYVLDPSLRDRPSQEPMNPEEKSGALTVNGRDHFGAVLIAPGDALSGQDRTIGDREDFLEGGNETGSEFTDCGNERNCNDIVQGISIDLLFYAVQRRVLDVVAEMFRDFYAEHGYLPYAAPFGSDECDGSGKRTVGALPFADSDGDCGGTVLDRSEDPSKGQWVDANEWFDLIVYRVDADCAGAGAACGPGSLMVDENEELQVVIAAAGRPLDGPAHDSTHTQDRSGPPGPDMEDYLDSEENTNGDTIFDDAPLRPDDNDSLRGLVVNE